MKTKKYKYVMLYNSTLVFSREKKIFVKYGDIIELTKLEYEPFKSYFELIVDDDD